MIIGDENTVPDHIKRDTSVILKGVIKHEEALQILSNAKFYISTSLIENSWNAASEGVILAQQSIISKIPPHLELLEDSGFTGLEELNTRNQMLYVTRDQVNINKLETWDKIISDMISVSKKRYHASLP